MNNEDQITPNQLEQMIRDVAEAGKATNLLPPSSIKLLGQFIRQVHKRYAREQVKIAMAARKNTELVHVRSRKAKFEE